MGIQGLGSISKSFLFGIEKIDKLYKHRFHVGRCFVKIAEISESGLETLEIFDKR